jgi:hypothetical protein
VVVGGRDVDRAGAQGRAVLGQDGVERRVAVQDRREQALAGGRDVQDHAQCGVEVGGQGHHETA